MTTNLNEFDFNPYFLLHILRSCIIETSFASKVINVLDPKIFKTKEKIFLFKLVRNYFREYKEAPKDHFYELFENEKKSLSEKSQKIALEVLETISEITHTNEQYLLNKLSEAVAYIEFEDALIEAAQLHKRKKLGEAKATILKAMRTPEHIKSSYYNFLQDESYVESRFGGKQYKMRTMIKELDNLIGGLNPGWLITILAPTKFGKTKLLLELCVAAILQGLNVLFVSLEMNRNEIDNALDQAIGFLGDRPGEAIDTMAYNKIKKEWYKTKKVVDTIFDLDIVSRNRKALGRFGGKLFISDQSNGRFNCYDQEALIEQIQNEEEVIFDVIATDYLGEMGSTNKGQKKKERISENTSGLKSNAKLRNIIQLTAQQIQRSAGKLKRFQSDAVADAIEPIWVSDLILAMMATPKEERENQYRIEVAEYRHGDKHGVVSIVKDLRRGAIALGKGKEIIDDEEENEDTEY
jgi:replicative DNA helicase